MKKERPQNVSEDSGADKMSGESLVFTEEKLFCSWENAQGKSCTQKGTQKHGVDGTSNSSQMNTQYSNNESLSWHPHFSDLFFLDSDNFPSNRSYRLNNKTTEVLHARAENKDQFFQLKAVARTEAAVIPRRQPTWHMQWHSEIDGSDRYTTDVIPSSGLSALPVIFQVVGVVLLLATPSHTALKRFIWWAMLPVNDDSNTDDKSTDKKTNNHLPFSFKSILLISKAWKQTPALFTLPPPHPLLSFSPCPIYCIYIV